MTLLPYKFSDFDEYWNFDGSSLVFVNMIWLIVNVIKHEILFSFYQRSSLIVMSF